MLVLCYFATTSLACSTTARQIHVYEHLCLIYGRSLRHEKSQPRPIDRNVGPHQRAPSWPKRPTRARASSTSANSRTRSRRSTSAASRPAPSPAPRAGRRDARSATCRDSQEPGRRVPPTAARPRSWRSTRSWRAARCGAGSCRSCWRPCRRLPRSRCNGLIATTHPAGPRPIVSGPYAEEVGMNARGNALGQQGRLTSAARWSSWPATSAAAAGVVGPRRPRPARQLGAAFAERTWGSPFATLPSPTARRRRDRDHRRGAEAPRLLVDQLAREPARSSRSLAERPRAVAPRPTAPGLGRAARVGPEHGRFRPRRADRAARADSSSPGRWPGPATSCAVPAGRGGSRPARSPPRPPVAKFALRIASVVAHAGGDARLFSMVYGSWVAGGPSPRAPATGR